MKHMKSKHIETVKMCRNEDENCKFGSAKCWFLHKENIEEAFKKKKNEIVSDKCNAIMQLSDMHKMWKYIFCMIILKNHIVNSYDKNEDKFQWMTITIELTKSDKDSRNIYMFIHVCSGEFLS